MMTKKQVEELELLIDRTSMAAVLAALVEICEAKSEHLISCWQSRTAAARWYNIARRLSSPHVYAAEHRI